MKRIVLLKTPIILFGLLLPLACTLPLTEKNTPVIPQDPSATPTYENCFWNWAYGEGSPEFDAAVMQEFTNQGIVGTLTSSSYGEIYSCDNSYHAKDLDVQLEIRVKSLDDQVALGSIAASAFDIMNEKLSISGISGFGNIQLTFMTDDGSTSCYWDLESNTCI